MDWKAALIVAPVRYGGLTDVQAYSKVKDVLSDLGAYYWAKGVLAEHGEHEVRSSYPGEHLHPAQDGGGITVDSRPCLMMFSRKAPSRHGS